VVVDAAALARRVLDDIEEVAQISAPGPGVSRIAYTREDALSRVWFKDRCERYGLRFEVDAIGNCYGWTPSASSRRPLLVGSHLDSVPSAGRYDGIVGVMVGLELARWVTAGELSLPIVAASFACEESTRFGFGTIGSGWLAGEVALEGAGAPVDREGIPLAHVVSGALIEEVGPVVERRIEDFLGLLEVHVDQGTIVTAVGARVGAVDTIWGVDRLEVTWSGQTAHSGGQWREDRRDALVAACGFVVAADAWWSTADPAGRQLQLTIGSLRVEPNSPNTVAGTVTAIVDTRASSLEMMTRSVREVVELAEAGTSRGVEVSTQHLGRSRPLEVDRSLAATLGDAAGRAGLRLPAVPSLAGHDALVIGRHLPAAMILVANPTGISHAPEEDLDPVGLEQALAIMVEVLPAAIDDLSAR
jgi:hydantoinase/carbamoylase family amidase